MKFYKVVINTEKGLCSVMAPYGGGHQTSIGRIYTPNHWTSATAIMWKRGYGLCVFANLYDATYFRQENTVHKWDIWECEVQEEIPLPRSRIWRWTNIHHKTSDGIMSIGYFDNIMGTYGYTFDGWPIGTKMFKKVKLTTLVPEYEYQSTRTRIE